MKTNQEQNTATVSIYLPAEGAGAYLEGAYNGVNFRVPTGRIVEVPRYIAEILLESRKGLSEEGDAAPFGAAGGRRIG
ncbi:MAG: hypothetical protein IJJ86_02850 [Clostridia bacterium]|nr:hypothetical protein [Clostridia bacterium]